ncbi:MAG: ATP cone domain-containing protein [Caldilineaceae bacterium]
MSTSVHQADPRARVNGTSHNGHADGHRNGTIEITVPETIIKRDGRVVPFDASLIENALLRCFNSLKQEPETPLPELTQRAVNIVAAKYKVPSVEQVQDIVEMVLLAAGEYEAAKHYILYRAERARLRADRPISDMVRAAFGASDGISPLSCRSSNTSTSTPASTTCTCGETWLETVDRAVAFLRELSHERLPDADYERLARASSTCRPCRPCGCGRPAPRLGAATSPSTTVRTCPWTASTPLWKR